jgi:hypothetical protein
MAKPMAIVLQTVNQMVEYAFCPPIRAAAPFGRSFAAGLKK